MFLILSPKLIVFITFLLIPSLVYPQSNSPSFLFDGTIPATTPLPLITITPGSTKKLMITLTGNTDTISITFQEQPYQSYSFKLFIRTNNQMESTQVAIFQSEENLSINLDSTRNLLILQGDKRFRISKFVREKQYDVQVKELRSNAEDSDADPNDTKTVSAPGPGPKSSNGVDRSTTYFLLAGIIGGLIGLVVLIKGGIILYKKLKQHLRKNSVFSVNSRTSNKRGTGDIEVGGVTPVLGFGEHALDMMSPEYKSSLTLDEKGVMENEMELVHQNFQKKEFPSSLTSIESGHNAKSTAASIQSMVSSAGSLQNIANKKGPQLAAITEENSAIIRPTLPLGPLKLPPQKLEELGTKSKSSFSRKLTSSKIAPSKPSMNNQEASKENNYDHKSNRPPKGKQGNKNQIQNKSPEQKKAVTAADIRELVERFKREKREQESIEISEDTSKDEEGEPVNYFSCMVCEKEKRSAIAEPCGHVFGCEQCTKRVISSSKGCCPLCSKKVKNSRPLQKEKETK